MEKSHVFVTLSAFIDYMEKQVNLPPCDRSREAMEVKCLVQFEWVFCLCNAINMSTRPETMEERLALAKRLYELWCKVKPPTDRRFRKNGPIQTFPKTTKASLRLAMVAMAGDLPWVQQHLPAMPQEVAGTDLRFEDFDRLMRVRLAPFDALLLQASERAKDAMAKLVKFNQQQLPATALSVVIGNIHCLGAASTVCAHQGWPAGTYDHLMRLAEVVTATISRGTPATTSS